MACSLSASSCFLSVDSQTDQEGIRSLTFCTSSQENFTMLLLHSITCLTKAASEVHSAGLEDIEMVNALLPPLAVNPFVSLLLNFCLIRAKESL